MAKDTSVARPLRADWSQLLSSVLNIACVLRTGPLFCTDTCGLRFDPERAEGSSFGEAIGASPRPSPGEGDWVSTRKTKKRPRLHAVLRKAETIRAVSLLFRWSGCRRLGRGRSRFDGRGRSGSQWLGSHDTRSGRRHTGLDVEGFDDRLRDVDGRSVPDHRATGPLLGRVQDHAVAIFAGILHDEWSHLGEDFISDLALLVLEIFLRILRGTIEALLFGLDLLC